MKVINLGEYGFSIVFNQSRDISAATITIYYTKPDGTEGEWPAIIDGTSFYYTLVEGDIDQIGTWVLWLYAKWTSPDKELWARTAFKVKDAPTERLP